jgi:hypothetical protein
MFDDDEYLGVMIEEFERKACTVAAYGVQETKIFASPDQTNF